jgi:hypothetical protein
LFFAGCVTNLAQDYIIPLAVINVLWNGNNISFILTCSAGGLIAGAFRALISFPLSSSRLGSLGSTLFYGSAAIRAPFTSFFKQWLVTVDAATRATGAENVYIT